jgi:phosphatidylglycerophosphate synthase
MTDKEIYWWRGLPFHKKILHPMALTWLRIGLSPAICAYLYIGLIVEAMGLLFLAELTDFFDGRLARHWGLGSDRGSRWDPYADKILHLPLFFYFLIWPRPDLPHYFLFREILKRNWPWLLAVFFAGYFAIEMMLVAVRRKLLDPWRRNKKDDRAKMPGKVKTWVGAFSIFFYMLGLKSSVLIALGGIKTTLIPIVDWLVAKTTVIVVGKCLVTAAQVTVPAAIVLGFLSLRSHIHLDRLFKAIAVKIRSRAARIIPVRDNR